MKVLVTGGAGFIGSALCRHAIDSLGWQLIVVDKLTYAGHLSSLSEVSVATGFNFIQADICDRDAIDAILLKHKPDAVMHLAAESHVDRSITGSSDFIATNVVGTFTLLEAVRVYWGRLTAAAQDKFRFLHISTDEVYGSLGSSGYFFETTPYAPRSPYAASKAASDHLVAAWHHTYGLPVIISNCSNNYGPFQLPEKLIPLTILNALEGLPLPIYGNGLNVRDWLFVQDHVEALILILTKGMPGETYNIGARSERTNLAVVERICDLIDMHVRQREPCRSLIKFVTDRPGHDLRYAIDPTKIEATLGWKPRIDFEAGLESTVTWYIANESWWRPLRETGHGKTRLGLPPAV